jgi:hypothetical protein
LASDYLVAVDTPTGSVPAGDTTVFSVRLATSPLYTGKQYSIRLNQAEVSYGNFTGSPTAENPYTAMNLGNYPSPGGAGFKGDILAVATYNSYKSDAEVRWIEQVLTDKWQKSALPEFVAPPKVRAETEPTAIAHSQGAISSWPNSGSLAGAFTQSSASAKPFLDFKLNVPTVVYDGAADYLIGPSTSAEWRFLHDGVMSGSQYLGATVVFAFRPSLESSGVDTVLDTSGDSASARGLNIKYDSGVGALSVRVSNGTGTYLVNTQTANGSVPMATTSIVSLRLQDGTAKEYSIRVDQSEVSSGLYTGSPSTGTPAGVLHLGSLVGGGGTLFQGQILAILGYEGYKTDGEVKLLEAYLAKKWKR